MLRSLIAIFVSLQGLVANAAELDASPCVGDQLSVPLARERTGHVSVKLKINGAEARVLVDTGANVNTLDVEQGQKLGPKVVPLPESAPVEGRATMTVAIGPRVLGLQEFSVMDLHFINIPSKRYGTEPFVGQLGAQFFTDFKARIDFKNMVLCLSPPMS